MISPAKMSVDERRQTDNADAAALPTAIESG
jgi:hypothetical protein